MVAVKVDEGWAWGTVVGGFIANFMIGGFSRVFGIVMEEYKEIFECSTSYMTLAGGLIYTFMYAMSIFVHLISSKVGGRKVMFAGTLLCALSLIGASLVTTVGPWVFFIGAGVGFSLSLIYFPCFVMLGSCFSKRIGLANGIAVSGMSAGQAVFPACVVYLMNKYSLRGAMLITAGLSLHFGIAAALLPTEVIQSDADETGTKKADDVDAGYRNENRVQGTGKRVSALRLYHRMKTWTTRKRKQWHKTPSDHFDKLLIGLYSFSRVLNETGHVGLTLLFPPYGKELYFSKGMIVAALGCSGAVDLISRFFVGWLSDLHLVRRSLILVFTALIEAGSGLALTFASSYNYYLAVNILFGLCGGASTTLLIVVLTDYVGSTHLSKGFATMMLCMGLAQAPSQFLLGYIADLSKTYASPIRLATLFLCFGAIILALDAPINHMRSRCKKPKENVEIGQSEFVSLNKLET